MLRKNVLNDITITSDSMPRCEEFKVEVLRNPKVKEKEVSVPYRVSLG